MRLYELQEEFLMLQNAIDEADDDACRDILKSALTVTVENAEHIIEYLVKMQRGYEADGVVFKAEKDHFAKKQASADNKAENLKRFIEDQLKLLGYDGDNKKKLKAGVFTAHIQKNAFRLVCEPSAIIPDTYYNVVSESVLDRAKLLEAVRNGEAIKGVTAEQSQSIRIK